jgi:hypothetical protein
MKKNHIIFYSSSSFMCARNEQQPKFETTGIMTLISLVRCMTYWLHNMFRTSGAPGPTYYQQQADYKIDIELDDKKAN